VCSALTRAAFRARWALLGLVSGVLSCTLSQSHLIYLTREQKTLDHIVWPGLVFALVVLLPMSRRAGDRWPRTAAALLASSLVYPLSWRIAAVSVSRNSAPLTLVSFTAAGLLGASVLAAAFLFGRPRCGRAAVTTVVAGTAFGGLMGAQLLAAPTFGTASDVLGIYMVLWQAAVAASLGRAVSPRSTPPTPSTSGESSPSPSP
jgi:hypothetical protein